MTNELTTQGFLQPPSLDQNGPLRWSEQFEKIGIVVNNQSSCSDDDGIIDDAYSLDGKKCHTRSTVNSCSASFWTYGTPN